MQKLCWPIASTVGSVLGKYYYNHNMINNLFYHCGATGDPPEAGCDDKITLWLIREAQADNTKALSLLGRVLEEFMDGDNIGNLINQDDKDAEKKRINRVLENYGLKYQFGGKIYASAVSHPSLHLKRILQDRDIPQIEEEFERAILNVETDPQTAATAASSILESLFKTYIEDEGLEMPSRRTISPLWTTVSKHLRLAPDQILDDDMKKILSGLTSIVNGIGSFRTHASSAHGKSRKIYRIQPRHARLVVHSAHTLAAFVLETWDSRKIQENE